MTDLKKLCPSCGKDLPENAPSGICPVCLIRAGLNQGYDPAPTVTPLSPGQFIPPDLDSLTNQLPQLEVLELIGTGGMGAVYKARQTKLDRIVALKVLKSDTQNDESFAQRFNREAQTLARLNHPGIVGIFDFGDVVVTATDGNNRKLHYIVMEYVDGADLRHLAAQGIPQADGLAILTQACEALQYAHEQGIVHRDIKPENILIDSLGQVKVADFGLAKLTSTEHQNHTLTGTHQVMGTPRYMAPEQMEQSHQVDHRADIYALGVVAYELLTGEIPLGLFERPSVKNPNLNAATDDVILTAIAREPEKRFASARQMQQALATADQATPASEMKYRGLSTIFDAGVGKAFRKVREGVSTNGQISPIVPGIISLVLSLVGAILHLTILILLVRQDPSGQLFGKNKELIFASTIILTVLSLILLTFGVFQRRAIWRPLLVFAVATATLILALIYSADTADWSNVTVARNCCLMMIQSFALLFTSGWDFRQHLADSRNRPRPKKKLRDIPETAHVGFVVPQGKSIAPHVAPHFQMLGYQLTDQASDEWTFERGARSGHMGIDLRKCLTRLKIRTGSRPDGGSWISCSWGVEAFVTSNEIPKLEAEGQSFARSLGVESVTLTKAQTKSVTVGHTLLSFLGSNSRYGHWKMPSRLNVFGILGHCELDLRQAEFEDDVSVLHVNCILGHVDVVVPQHMNIDVTGSGIAGLFTQNTGARSATEKSGPKKTLRISGVSCLGCVSIASKKESGWFK